MNKLDYQRYKQCKEFINDFEKQLEKIRHERSVQRFGDITQNEIQWFTLKLNRLKQEQTDYINRAYHTKERINHQLYPSLLEVIKIQRHHILAHTKHIRKLKQEKQQNSEQLRKINTEN